MPQPSSDFQGNILIIGASAAGVSAAKEIRKVNRASKVTLITEESHFPYYRPMLIRRIAEPQVERNPSFYLNDEAWYGENGITLIRGERVDNIDAAGGVAFTARGLELHWDRLILAAGSRPFVPIPGALDKGNVFAIRTLDDARAVNRAQQTAERAVVIGGGLLGLETAYTLLKTGKQVRVVELAERILPIQLDQEGSQFFQAIMEKENCPPVLGDVAEALEGGERVTGVRLKSGSTLPADMVVFSIGVRANLDLPKACGLRTNRAALVNERMETSVPGVYACGDVAEHVNYVCLWMPAIRQGAVAGLNAIGADASFTAEEYPASMMSFGTQIFSIGDIGRREPLENYTLEKRINSEKGVYKKLYFREGKLTGGVFIGDNRKTLALARAVREGAGAAEANKLMDE